MGNSIRFPSLSSKIVAGYLAIALLMLGASLFTFERLRTLEAQVLLGEHTAALLESVLEVRRFERNYFLHRAATDYAENGRYVARTRELLNRHRQELTMLTDPTALARLETLLDGYRQRLAAYAGGAPGDLPREEVRVREAGKELVAAAEDLARTERRIMHTSLAFARTILVTSIALLAAIIAAAGLALSRSIVRPLRQLQANVDALSRGRRDELTLPSQDREIRSIIDTFNQMLRELAVRQRHLVRSEKLAALGTMLSGVAHELNNPLSNISLSCQILQEEMDSLEPAQQARFLAQIDDQTQRARNIVRSLLDFARDQPVRRERIGLQSLVEETLALVRGELATGTAVELRIPPDLTVAADRQKLQQVLVNLVRNGMEAAGPRGHLSISARQRHLAGDQTQDPVWSSGCHLTGNVADLQVTDDGPGIAADVLPRIFDPFFTTKDVGQGMGLGLFIAYEIVEEHGGCLAVNSQPGQGTTFVVRLPDAPLPGQAAHD